MNRLVQKIDRIEKSFFEIKRVQIGIGHELASAQVKIIGRKIFGRLLLDQLLFDWSKCGGQSSSNGFRNFALDSKDIGDITVITLCPDGVIVAGID
jgi:hypothetical protein